MCYLTPRSAHIIHSFHTYLFHASYTLGNDKTINQKLPAYCGCASTHISHVEISVAKQNKADVFVCLGHHNSNHRLGGLNHRNFPHNSSQWKPKVKAPSGLFLGQAFLPGLHTATLSLCLHIIAISLWWERTSLVSLPLMMTLVYQNKALPLSPYLTFTTAL